jgi:hypothetical protein
MVYVADVAPAMGVPPLRHWKVEAPDAATENETGVPTLLTWLKGWLVIDGMVVLTVSVAAELVWLPQAFVTMQSYVPSLLDVTDGIV